MVSRVRLIEAVSEREVIGVMVGSEKVAFVVVAVLFTAEREAVGCENRGCIVVDWRGWV